MQPKRAEADDNAQAPLQSLCMNELITLEDIHAAQRRIAGTAERTPLVRLTRARLRMAGYAELSESTPDIYLKDESAQPIGSFKLRGAFNKIAQLSADELRRGVITYSSGNHAQGVAFAARALGGKAVIVMPDNAPAIKRADCAGWAGEQRAAAEGRGTGCGAWLHDGSSV